MSHTGSSSSDAAVWCWDSELDTLERSNSARKGWCTKYRKKIARLEKEKIDLRMAHDNYVDATSNFSHPVVSGF